MKKCVLRSGTILINEKNETMFSGNGNRLYQSTGAITISAAVQIRKHEGKYAEKVNVPRNLPKLALGSVFTEEKVEFKVQTCKAVRSVQSIVDIDDMRYVSDATINKIKEKYDNDEELQFLYNGKPRNSSDLTLIKDKLREMNTSIRNKIEGQVRNKMQEAKPDQISKLINRAYLNSKMMLSPISVVINVQLSHNIFTSNYAVQNINLDDLELGNYINNNGTYTARSERGKVFTIPCNSVEHANKVLNSMHVIMRSLMDKITEHGYDELVDINSRSKDQIVNDEQLKSKLSNPDDVNHGLEALNLIEDNSTTTEVEVLKSLGINTDRAESIERHLFD